MLGFISGYHEVNICYYGRTMVNFNKTETVRKIQFKIFTDVTDFDKEHKLTSAP